MDNKEFLMTEKDYQYISRRIYETCGIVLSDQKKDMVYKDNNMYKLDAWECDKKYSSLHEIDLDNELISNYRGYPTGVVVAFIRCGSRSVGDMKKMLEDSIQGNITIRNLGPKRMSIAKSLIEKYEEEALL